MKILENMEPSEVLALMDETDGRALSAVAGARGAIAKAARDAAKAIKAGGRLIYVGAGTSGRLGVLDASECPPTFSSKPENVIGIIAGGSKALTTSVEGAEDDLKAGKRAISRLKVDEKDVVVGITASGTTPYVLAALEEAIRRGAEAWIIKCQVSRPIEPSPVNEILLDTGPEVIRGSTRLAAGTATKLALNRISTAAFIMMGKVYGDLMVDVMPTNKKLVKRAVDIISKITGCERAQAQKFLEKSGMRPKVACLMVARGVSKKEAERRLHASDGFLRRALEKG
ncbi:MAG: N-acetylmuramic acid 6-phosphate etherase [Nitrospirota bacterium]